MMGLYDRDWYREEIRQKRASQDKAREEKVILEQDESSREKRFVGYFSGRKRKARIGKSLWLFLIAPWIVLMVLANFFFPQNIKGFDDRAEQKWQSVQQDFDRRYHPQSAAYPGYTAPKTTIPHLLNGTNTRVVDYVILADQQGHYRTKGTINGREVLFLVDTGATTVTIPESLQYFLSLSKGSIHKTITASDTYSSFATVISDLVVGPFHFGNVRADLNPRAQSNEILLGMSVLKHLEMVHRHGELTLRGLGAKAQPVPLQDPEPAAQGVMDSSEHSNLQRSRTANYDNAADNHRRVEEIRQREAACRFWRRAGIDVNLMTARENINRYCR